jgi:CubicO group peptidase (beta-lactamase class C family)
MKVILRNLLLAAVLAAGLGAQASETGAARPAPALVPGLPAKVAVNPANLKKAQAAVAEWYRRTPHPGVAVVFANASGPLWTGAFGLADLDARTPMAPDTVVPIGSLTKSFTAMAVLQLAEQGKVDLDAPVIKYLPWFRLADKSVSDRITVRNCLNNASGIPSRDAWSQAGQSLSEAEIERDVRALSAVKSRGVPGATFEYANENWEILGLIIKSLTGADYGVWMRDAVLAPLGMAASTTELSRLDSSGSITGSFFDAEGFMEARRGWSAGGLPAGSGMVSTARDLGAYLACLLNRGVSPLTGRTLLKPESLETLWTPAVRFPAFPAEARGGDRPAWYAMGWIRAELDGRTLVFHGGNLMRSCSMTAFDPATGLGASLLFNSPGDLDRYRYQQGLAILNDALHLLAGQATTDWGTMLKPDPNLAEPFADPGTAWLDALAGAWVSPEGYRLDLSRPAGATHLVARFETAMLRENWRLDFIDRARVVFSNPGGTMKGSFGLGADGQARQLDGLQGAVFKRQAGAGGRHAALDFAGWTSVLPKDWQVEAAGAGFTARRGGATLRGGLVVGAAPAAELSGRLAGALAAAGWKDFPAAPKPEAVNGAWSGRYFWESLVILPAPGGGSPAAGSVAGPARQLSWCETPRGLLWLALEAPAAELTGLNREALRPFLERLGP